MCVYVYTHVRACVIVGHIVQDTQGSERAASTLFYYCFLALNLELHFSWGGWKLASPGDPPSELGLQASIQGMPDLLYEDRGLN